jgi:hypothetical protein
MIVLTLLVVIKSKARGNLRACENELKTTEVRTNVRMRCVSDAVTSHSKPNHPSLDSLIPTDTSELLNQAITPNIRTGKPQAVMNDTDDFCPEIPETWPVGNWPKANQTLSLANCVLHTCVSIWSVGYMIVNRDESVYRSRNVVLMAISAFGIWATVFNVLMRDYFGRDAWPCDVMLWFNYLSLGLWFGPYTVQLLQVCFFFSHTGLHGTLLSILYKLRTSEACSTYIGPNNLGTI